MQRCIDCSNGTNKDEGCVFCNQYLVTVDEQEAKDENNCDGYEN